MADDFIIRDWDDRDDWDDYGDRIPVPRATEDIWVSKDPNGRLVAVRVTEMKDSHLFRWIQFFRRRYRGLLGHSGTDKQIDFIIRSEIITAPAIYREAAKRKIALVSYAWENKAPAVAPTPNAVTIAKPGVRRITLDDDE